MIKRETENTIALVLGSTQYGDSSAIVSLAGDNGLFALMAKGIYKPKSQLKPLLITGNIVQVEYAKAIKGPSIASSLRVVMDVSDSLKDYASSCYLMYLAELSLSLFQYGDKFPYEEMKIIINALKEKKDVLSLSILTLGVLHHVLGIEINTDDCISCHKSKNIVSYDLSEGGFICSDCFSKYDASLKDKMDLFVLKYAFSSLSEDILSKSVPKSSGIRVLAQLNDNLVTYFDLKPMKSFSLLLNALY
jgi:DNA repair protein RecO